MQIALVIIFVLFGSIVSDDFVVIKDAAETSPPLTENIVPALDYHNVSSSVHTIAMNIDKFIDILVDVIRLGGRSVNNIPLPDVTETFQDKVLFVYVDGRFIMRHGELHNIKSISRHGNATLQYDNFKVYIDTAFIFDRLDFNYDFISEIVSLGPKGYMYGDVRQMIMGSVFVYDIMSNKFSLNKTTVVENVPIDVNVKVSVVIDWLANPIISWLSGLYERKIITEIQKAVEKVIRDKLPAPTSFLNP